MYMRIKIKVKIFSHDKRRVAVTLLEEMGKAFGVLILFCISIRMVVSWMSSFYENSAKLYG